MPQTFITPLLADWHKLNRDLVLAMQVQAKAPFRPLEASPDIAQAAFWGSLAGMIIGLLASAGPYLAHNWTAWLSVTPLLLMLAGIVGVWLAMVINESNG